MRKPAAIPASIALAPIDNAARNGRFQSVFSGEFFAVARFVDGAWQHSSGIAVDFEPTHYRVAQCEGSHAEG